VSTRRLILLALACGLAILVAGSIQLLRISGTDDRVQLLAEGDTARLTNADATVERSAIVDDKTLVVVRFRFDAAGNAATSAPADEFWTLLAGGELLEPVAAPEGEPLERPGSCVGASATEGSELTCTLAFDVVEGSKTLAFRVGDEQRQWRISA
jgi:hypothetical protein